MLKPVPNLHPGHAHPSSLSTYLLAHFAPTYRVLQQETLPLHQPPSSISSTVPGSIAASTVALTCSIARLFHQAGLPLAGWLLPDCSAHGPVRRPVCPILRAFHSV